MVDESKLAQDRRCEGPQFGEIYKHYKGGLYIISGRCVDSATMEQRVNYNRIKTGEIECWSHKLEEFTMVFQDGTPRFEKVAETMLEAFDKGLLR